MRVFPKLVYGSTELVLPTGERYPTDANIFSPNQAEITTKGGQRAVAQWGEEQLTQKLNFTAVTTEVKDQIRAFFGPSGVNGIMSAFEYWEDASDPDTAIDARLTKVPVYRETSGGRWAIAWAHRREVT